MRRERARVRVDSVSAAALPPLTLRRMLRMLSSAAAPGPPAAAGQMVLNCEGWCPGAAQAWREGCAALDMIHRYGCVGCGQSQSEEGVLVDCERRGGARGQQYRVAERLRFLRSSSAVRRCSSSSSTTMAWEDCRALRASVSAAICSSLSWSGNARSARTVGSEDLQRMGDGSFLTTA